MFALHLKSLEIQGFKSFPEKTRLTFDKPITGIVGPNGSGKSNISDAILWVMGEQSTRTLRGGKMEDVIFGGTQRRSQLGFSEVSIILDNSAGLFSFDNTEIMLTRRYYRSGESEYYINREMVRLKDLSEMLMDTGLGREGYSVIGQGRIAEILSSKSKDRRAIFEEAAGISRYRHRKEESEHKLQQTDENLVRIGDRISELEMQIKPLSEQAEIAKKYLLFRDELRGLEIAVWLRELESIRTRADKAENDHNTAKRALDDANRELEAVYDRSDSLSERVRECDVSMESAHAAISNAESRQNEAESSIAVLKTQLESNAAQIERLNQELSKQDESHDGVGAQIGEREARLETIKENRNKLEQRRDELDTELKGISGLSGEFSEEISTLLKSDGETQNKTSDVKSELSALASQAQELYDIENATKQELSSAAENLETQKTEHIECARMLEKASADVVSLNNIVNGLELKLKNRNEKAQAALEKLERIGFEIKTMESRFALLSEMEKEYQGYSKAVKRIMQESKRGALKNIHGTVGELVSTSDRYTAAIETALGGAMQNIIVATEEDGKAAINLLKRHDAGRATFLPISTIRGNALDNKELNSDSGFEGIALNLIEFDNIYNGIYTNLLGRVAIAEDLNSAIRIAKKHGYGFKIVTLDGQIINAGGSMTGGSAASGAGVLTRANELKQIAGRIETIKSDKLAAERETAGYTRDKNAVEYELETAKAELRTVEDSFIRFESEEAHRAQLLNAANDKIVSLGAEVSSLEQRIRVNNEETKAARLRINELEEESEKSKRLIEEVVRSQEKLGEERDRVNSVLSDLRAESASLDAERDALVQTIAELTARRDVITGARARQQEELTQLKERNDGICDEILEKEKTSLTIQDEIGIHRHTLSEISVKKLDLEAERNNQSKEIQDKTNKVLDFTKECSRLEQKKDTAQIEEKQIIDKIWDTYELGRSAAAKAASEIDSLNQAQKRISSLKHQISELGNPNIGAIEEFERVNTRYVFLTDQRDDVERAKNELTGIINEITAQMQEIFTREFAVINGSFERIFKELFGGGRATLILEDPSDVLGSGIDIQVQPPGKSLKTITLLSGGEKAFVAIAIYFAILTVRPPPFVVMDEIEAALDDANVLRFATYLRQMSDNTQMIVITHKRATMEEADVLYGVTMQELGVSNILKIDLDEAEKHIKRRA